MSCETRWSESRVLEIWLPSNLVNLFNFIIFDILLISVVFYLTTEISGRLNYLSLSNGSPRKLEIQCPPLLGGGLCSTSRVRMYCLFFLRFLAFALIFASNLAIDGVSKNEIITKFGVRRVPGSLDILTYQKFKRLVDLRLSCQIARKGFVYFGELRENDRCERDVSLLSDPVAFSLNLQRIDVKPRLCKIQETAEAADVTLRDYRCENARIQCLVPNVSRFDPDPRGCLAVMEDRGTTYGCSVLVKEVDGVWTGECRVIRNFRVKDDRWFGAFAKGTATFYASIGITTIARTENTTLKFQGEEKDVTQVHYAWFVLFGAKVCLALALAGVTAYLVGIGARCVVHDEKSLASLLSATVNQYSTLRQDDSIYLNAKTTARKTVFGHRCVHTSNGQTSNCTA